MVHQQLIRCRAVNESQRKDLGSPVFACGVKGQNNCNFVFQLRVIFLKLFVVLDFGGAARLPLSFPAVSYTHL